MTCCMPYSSVHCTVRSPEKSAWTRVARRSGFVAVEIPFTPRAKRVLELSLEEARQLGHNYIGTEHLLLGLLREGEGVAARVLENLGADPAKIRTQVGLSALPTRPHSTLRPLRCLRAQSTARPAAPCFPHLSPIASQFMLCTAPCCFPLGGSNVPLEPIHPTIACSPCRSLGSPRRASKGGHVTTKWPPSWLARAPSAYDCSPPTDPNSYGSLRVRLRARLSWGRGRTAGDPHGWRVRRDGGRGRRRTGGRSVAFPPRCPLLNTARKPGTAWLFGLHEAVRDVWHTRRDRRIFTMRCILRHRHRV
jgi:hypothetical protein